MVIKRIRNIFWLIVEVVNILGFILIDRICEVLDCSMIKKVQNLVQNYNGHAQ